MQVALISMPWAIFNRPSIQLGSLTSFINSCASEIQITPFHPYLGAANRIGLETYRTLSEDTWAGEALYCALLFPEMHEKAQNVFYKSLGKRASKLNFDFLCNQLDDHLYGWLDENDFSATRLAGFSVCFGQLPASLLAAKRLKSKNSHLKITLGGSTCVPSISASILKVFAYIDFIITGEGEQPFLTLCRFLQDKEKTPGPGVLAKREGALAENGVPATTKNEIQDINTLPVPNYDHYFSELKQSSLSFIPQLPIEFSRGCWWNKCTFCNLNLQWCGYRFKKNKRMQSEVDQMIRKYHCLDFAFTDNALPPVEAERLFTSMQENEKDVRFFAEIRTILNPEQLAIFHRGGLDSVQIGIESFSNSLLKRMNKGVTVMDNIAAMKFCSEAGIHLDGNLILEFPGSTEAEVSETLEVLDYVLPYRPLTSAGFFLGHGSPVWNEPHKFGIRAIRHHPYNRNMYPKPILEKMELLIMQGIGDRDHQKKIWQPVRQKIRQWKTFHEKRERAIPPLSYRNGEDFIIIRQERPHKPTLHHRLVGTSRKIYLACMEPVSIKSLLRDFNSITEKALTTFLDDLENNKLLFRDVDKYLALAVKRPASS